MTEGGSIVGLDFDNTVSWPAYDWMGVAKSALESTSRYLARYLGPQQIRVNLVAAGPVKTDRRPVDPRLLEVRGRVGRPGPARLGRAGQLGRGQGLRGAAVGLVPADHRRDRPRRRRLPHHRRLTTPERTYCWSGSSVMSPTSSSSRSSRVTIPAVRPSGSVTEREVHP